MGRLTAAVVVAFTVLAGACQVSQDVVADERISTEEPSPETPTPAPAGDPTAPAAPASTTPAEQPTSDDDQPGAEDPTPTSSPAPEPDPTASPTAEAEPTGSTPDADATFSIDWWGCWRAADAVDATGGTPGDGQPVANLPNCADGPSSVGVVADMSHPDGSPIFRSGGVGGGPSIEFTFDGDTLLQTNGGAPWIRGDVLAGSAGVTLAWVGMMTDVDSHNAKYLVSGLSEEFSVPQLLVEGEGPNRFAGWGGGGVEARSSDGTVRDFEVHGVILYLPAEGSDGRIEIDGEDVTGGLGSTLNSDVAGLTLGNHYNRGFSTTDHQFVFLGMAEGQLSEADKGHFWAYVERVATTGGAAAPSS